MSHSHEAIKANENRQRYCLNCHYPLPVRAKYCPQCSQKTSTGKVTLHELLHELLHTTLHLDSTLFATLQHLFIPARLTIDFFKGKHKRFAEPVRLFLVVGALGFTLLHLSESYEENEQNVYELKTDQTKNKDGYLDPVKVRDKNDEFQLFLYYIDSVHQNLTRHFTDTASLRVMNQFVAKIQLPDSLKRDSVQIGTRGIVLIEPVVVSLKDYKTAEIEKIYKDYKVTGYWNKLLLKQQLKFERSHEDINDIFKKKMFWMFFWMMPAIALFLKLLYVRNNFFYIEHLVFLLHFHSLAFIVFPIGVIMEDKYSDSKAIAFALVFLLIFLFIAMYRYYRQRIWKTLLKFVLLFSSYIVVLVIYVLLTMLIGLILF